MAEGYRLQWTGALTEQQVVRAVIGGLNEFHIGAETPIKAILQPGAGVITGTLRRSVHAAAPTYNYSSDDVIPTPGTPDRGGTGDLPQKQGAFIVGTIGSGMSYALPMENLYGYVRAGYDNHRHELLPALEKHARLQGLK